MKPQSSEWTQRGKQTYSEVTAGEIDRTADRSPSSGRDSDRSNDEENLESLVVSIDGHSDDSSMRSYATWHSAYQTYGTETMFVFQVNRRSSQWLNSSKQPPSSRGLGGCDGGVFNYACMVLLQQPGTPQRTGRILPVDPSDEPLSECAGAASLEASSALFGIQDLFDRCQQAGPGDGF